MRNVTAASITQAVVQSFDGAANPRFKQVVERLVAGGTPKNVADEFKLTHAYVLTIWSRAKRNARQLLEGLQTQVS